jgi:hypothetical protein
VVPWSGGGGGKTEPVGAVAEIARPYSPFFSLRQNSDWYWTESRVRFADCTAVCSTALKN